MLGDGGHEEGWGGGLEDRGSWAVQMQGRNSTVAEEERRRIPLERAAAIRDRQATKLRYWKQTAAAPADSREGSKRAITAHNGME